VISVSTGPWDDLAERRPRRVDARRNYNAILAAARGAFAERGIDVALEEIARRADVGIATLYRNFPTREDLIESVYVDEVQAVCAAAAEFEDLEPWDALVAWLRRFVSYVGTKHALVAGLNKNSVTFQNCRTVLYGAGEPLLLRAQKAGVARADASIDDVMRLVTGISGVGFLSDEQRDRVLAMAIDGVHVRG
jgi:AcrR family transcriptional regulator